jgi:O-antigen/teichoic acid export membrane protein
LGKESVGEDVSKHSKELAKGTLFSFAGNAFFKVVSFIYIVVIAKVVAQDDLGLFYLAMGFVSVTAIADDLGLASSLARYIPFFQGKGEGGKIRRLVGLSYLLVVLVALLLMAGLWLSSDFIGQSYQNPLLAPAIRTLTVYLVLTNIFRVNTNILQGCRDIASLQLAQNLQNLFKLVITLALVPFLGSSFEAIAYGVILSFVAVIPFAFYRSRQALAKLGTGGPPLGTAQLVSEILPFGLMMNLYQSLGAAIAGANAMMLGYFTDPASSAISVAVFTVVTTLSYALMAFQSSINSIFLPIMSNLHGKGNTQQMLAVTETAQRWALLLSLPPGICLILLSPDIISAVYGESFLSGSLTMSIFSIGLVLGAFTAMLPAALSSMRLVRIQLYILALAGALNIMLGIVLIPAYGMEGAACAGAVYSISSSLMYYYFARKHLEFRVPQVTLRLGAAGLMAILVILLLRPLVPVSVPFPLSGIYLADQAIGLAFAVLKIAAVGAVFMALTMLLKCFKEEDVGIVRKVMRKAFMPDWAVTLFSGLLMFGVAR